MSNGLIERRQQVVLCDEKWHKLIKRTWLFKYIPFVEIVFGSGSLAIGNVDEQSDSDMLIGVRTGRIFTARFFSALAFNLFGWRRAKEHGNAEAADKICLNHFVTPERYRLQLEPNEYWRLLYQRIVPLYGAPHRIQRFYDENAALIGERSVVRDLRYKHTTSSDIKNAIEFIFSGALGDKLEEFLKKYQVARIERGREGAASVPHRILVDDAGVSAVIELPPLITCEDEELEFHPDPAVIEMR